MAKDYLPSTDGDLNIWLGNFQAKLATYGLTCGLTAGEVTATSADCTTLSGGINNAEAQKNLSKSATAAKDTMKKNLLPTLRNTIKRMKTHTAYTEEIGQDLGIIGSDGPTPDKPTLKGKATPNYVLLEFIKKGFDGVNIYARLKGQSTWTFLARDTQSPYHDTRALAVAGTPETREYMCMGVIADEEVGEESDIVSVVYGG